MNNTDVNGLEVLSRAEAVALLETQEVGRLVYTRRALPAVIPVNFVVRGGAILIRTGSGSSMAQAVRGAVHDLAIQRLFATSMSLQGAYKITQKPAVARRIAQAIEDLDDTVKVIRSTIFALHAHELDQDDAPSVRALVMEECERAVRSLGFTPAVRFTGPVDALVTEEVAVHLLPVLRETLSNAARHAHATRVDVDLAASQDRTVLTVADDGVGIPVGGRRSGLANLRERAEQLGGTFTAVPGPDGGTVATWSVPARPHESGDADETSGDLGRAESP